ITLPDDSSIKYTYDAFFPRTVSRVSPAGEIVFTNTYEKFDLSGNLTSETLFDYCDRNYSFDRDGTKTSVKTDLIQEVIQEFGQAGEILQIETCIEDHALPKKFSYDPLYQLITETEHTYSYDYMRNRIGKDAQQYHVDPANQLLSDGNLAYSYDPQGRLVQ